MAGYYWLVLVWLGLLSLWLRSGFPIFAKAQAPHDDLLFARSAVFLRHLQWLGTYDNLTLAKGMFYSFFVAAAYVLHVDLKTAEHVVYLLCAAGFTMVAAGARRRLLGVILFAALALNSAMWTFSLARVTREGVYTSLSLGLVAAFAGMLSPRLLVQDARRALALSMLAGFLGAAFWLTREEGLWLFPALCAVAAGAVHLAHTDAEITSHQKTAILRNGTRGLAIALAIALVGVVTVAGINQLSYGVFTDVDMKAPGFTAAYGALSRVKHEHPQPFVAVPKDVREKVYSVSPAAAELRAYLEGDRGAVWRAFGCLGPCPDIQTGWFIWALRDAVADAGHYKSAAETEAFYRRVADEIDAACDEHRLDCLAPRRTLRPPLRTGDLQKTLGNIIPMTAALLSGGEGEISSRNSVGSPEFLAFFRTAVRGEMAPVHWTEPVVHMHGWLAAPNGPPGLALIDGKGNISSKVPLARTPAIDAVLTGPPMQSGRFNIAPTCADPDCALQISLSDGAQIRLPLASLEAGVSATPDYILTVDDIQHAMPAVRDRKQFLARMIAHLYALCAPALFVLACIGLLVATRVFRRDRDHLAVVWLGFAALVAVMSRVGLLSYLDVTSFPARSSIYLAPATPFAIAVIVLGNWLGLQALRRIFR